MLLKRFAVSDHATHQIGEMIHDADLEEGKFQRAECVGLDLLFKGWARLGLDDTEILEKGFACFDALHAALRKKLRPFFAYSRDASSVLRGLGISL
jgi:hypothetical protein